MLCLIITALASTVHGAPSASSNRFLFIVDASAAMKPLETKLRETVFDLIYSGMRGQMTNGDTYGVWLVNGQNNTSFPMETWKHKHILELAAGAASYVKTNGAKGKAHLEVAFADVQNVLKNVGDLTVILVTDGSTPIMGTPFDDAINARWQALAPGLKRAKATLNTVLVAQDGAFVAWAANSPEFLIEIPYVVPKPKPARVNVAVTKTNASEPDSAAVNPSVLNSVAAVKPRIATTPIIITKESVALERRSYQSMTTAAEVPSAPVLTNSITPISAATTNATAASTTNISSVVAAKAPVETAPTNVAPAIAAAPIKKVEPVALATVALTPIHSPSEESSSSGTTLRAALLWAGVGAGAMLGLVMVVMILRRSPEPSLISQALAREQFTLH